MNRRPFSFLSVVLPIALIVALSTVCGSISYAKGVTRSGPSERESRESRSDNSRRQSDDSRRPSTNSQRQSSDSRQQEVRSNSVRPSSPPPASTRSDDKRSEPRMGGWKGSRSDELVPSRQPAPARTITPSREPVQSRSPIWSSRPEQRETSRNTDTKGLYRKDYDDIGRIFKQRQERRTPSRNEWRNYDSNRRDRDHVNFKFHGRYNHYRFDYVPGYSYPSAYCYYYGYVPPFVQGIRIIYVEHHDHPSHLYIDLPSIIFSYDNDRHGSSYYLADRQYASLSDTLRDISQSWERGDIDLLMRHVRSHEKVGVYIKGDYAYSIDRQDYYEMTQDAMSSIRTDSFRFYRVKHRSNSEAIAYGKHTYIDYDGDDYNRKANLTTVYVTYYLEKSGANWYITDAGCSTNQIDR